MRSATQQVLRIVFLLIIFALSNTSLWAKDFDHSHSKWTSWLQAHTREVPGPATKVNYGKARLQPQLLSVYLDELSAVTQVQFQSWNREQKMAFLINAYNAFTVKLIIDNKPVPSIRKLGGLLSGPWKIAFVPLLGKTMTLDEIEHERLRPVFKDSRIHFAVVCASIGCPRLQQTAFTPQNLETLLEIGTREFLADQSRNRIEVVNGKTILHISKIFKWYAQDFGNQKQLVAFVLRYSPKVQGADSEKSAVHYTDYDWNLNQ